MKLSLPSSHCMMNFFVVTCPAAGRSVTERRRRYSGIFGYQDPGDEK
jgi:hypothetical protein